MTVEQAIKKYELKQVDDIPEYRNTRQENGYKADYLLYCYTPFGFPKNFFRWVFQIEATYPAIEDFNIPRRVEWREITLENGTISRPTIKSRRN